MKKGKKETRKIKKQTCLSWTKHRFNLMTTHLPMNNKGHPGLCRDIHWFTIIWAFCLFIAHYWMMFPDCTGRGGKKIVFHSLSSSLWELPMDIALAKTIQLFSISSRVLFSLFGLFLKINCSYNFLARSMQKACSNSFVPMILGLAPFAFLHLLFRQVFSW